MSQKMLNCAPYKIVIFTDSPSSKKKQKIYCVPSNWIFMVKECNYCLFPCSPFDDSSYPDDIALLIRTSAQPSLVWRSYAVQIVDYASTYEKGMKLLTESNKRGLTELPSYFNHISTLVNSAEFKETSSSSEEWSDSSSDTSFSDLSDCDLCDCSHENKSNISESTLFSQDFSLSTRNLSYKNIVNSTFKTPVHYSSYLSLDCSRDLLSPDQSCIKEQSKQSMRECRIYEPALPRTKENESTLPMKNIHDFYEFEKKLKDNYEFIQQFIDSLHKIFDEKLPPVANIHKILKHYVTIDLLSLLVQPTLLKSRPHYNASLFSSYLFGFFVSKSASSWEAFDSNYYFAAVEMHLNLNKTILNEFRKINL